MTGTTAATPGGPDRLELDVRIKARTVTRWLLAGLATLLFCHLLTVYLHFVPHVRAEAWTVLFDMDLEANIPTFFNCALFFLCSVLMVLKAAGRQGRLRRGWFILAGVFAFLGVDEGTQIHEKFMLVTLRLMDHGAQSRQKFGWLYYAWVIPYMGAAVALGLVLVRWFIALAPRLRRSLVLCGLLYIFGAVFLEMYSGKVAEQLDPRSMDAAVLASLPCQTYGTSICHDYANIMYVAIYTAEEVCELLALVLCADVLLRSLERRVTTMVLRLMPKDAVQSS